MGIPDGRGKFTISLVVTHPVIYLAWMGRELPKNPATALFPVQMRIGCLIPPGRDVWWEVDETTRDEPLCREVTEALTEYGLPFFDGFLDSHVLLERLRKEPHVPGIIPTHRELVRGVLAAHLGLREEARAAFDGILVEASHPGFRANIERAASRVGV